MANGIILEPIAISSVTASNTATGYSASNVTSDFMGLVWKTDTGSATRTLTLDLGSDVDFNTIVLLGLNGALAAWDWSVEIAADGDASFASGWTGSDEDLLAGATMPVSGKGKAIWQAPGGAPTAGRYIRITFKNLSSAAVECARVIVAQKFQPERNFRFGAALGIRSTGGVEFSRRGLPLIERGVQLRGIGISYDASTEAEIETNILPLLERVGNEYPICIVRDPDANAQRQNRIYFGYLTGDLGAIWSRHNGFTTSFNLVAVA